MTAIVDADARRRIVQALHESQVVRAGAGAGKTTTMVERIAHAVLDGHGRLDELVAISFTERSARDLARKVRTRLERERAGLDVDRGFLGTIHAFCLSLLRTYPIEAGLPPLFATADDIASAVDAERRTRRVLRRLYDRAADDADLADALRVVLGTGLGSDGLATLVRQLDLQWHRLEAWAPAAPPADHEAAFARLCAVVDDAATCGADPADRLVAVVAEWRSRLAAAGPGLAGRREAAKGLPSLGNAGRTPVWQRAHGCTPAELRERLVRHAEAVVAAVDEAATERLLGALVPDVLEEARARLAAGRVTFDDLLVLAARLVRDTPAIRAELQRRHRLLFVDEYQDTDAVQHELVLRLASGPGGVEPGRLFVVGDPKQSIYGFRAADVALFEQLGSCPEVAAVDLVTNFRSRPGIISWVNAVGEAWFPTSPAQVPFARLAAARPGPPPGADPGPDVTLLGTDTPAGTTAEASRRAEAADLAATIQRALADGWLVRAAPEGEATRPVRLGDIAVLLRTRTGLAVLESTFRAAGVPYRLDGGSLVYDTREVRELLRVLRVVDDPTDELALVSALRTSICGLTDVELLAHRQAGGRWDLLAPAPPGPVADAFAWLRDLVDRKAFRTPGELLTEIAEERLTWPAALVEGPQAARETWRRVRFVVDEARAFADATGGTVRDYLAWVDRQVADVERREVSPDETDEDAVRVLTIHAAKGLEYPVVLVAGLATDPPFTPLVTARWIDGVLRARIGEIKPAAFAEVRDADGVAAQAEDARLLYVACTRAEDHLVVSCHGPRNASGVVRKSLLAHAIDHLRAAGGADEPATAEPARPAAASVPVPGAPERDAPVPGAEEFAARPEAAGRRSSWSATALAELLARGTAAEPPPAVPRDPLDDDGRHDELEDATGGDGFRARSRGLPDDDADLVRRPPPGTDAIAPVDTIDDQPADAALAKDPRPAGTPPDARGRYGTAVGRAVHAVLQDVDLGGDGSDVPALVDARALAEDVPARLRPAVERLTRSILASDVVARMRRSPLVRRELYVGAEVEGHVVWGYLDAVFADERGRLVVVDFKTDQAPADAELLLARYRGQLATYLLALEAATGREVGDAWLVVGRDDGAPATCLALTGAARRRAVDEVRSVLASRAGAPGPQRLPGFG